MTKREAHRLVRICHERGIDVRYDGRTPFSSSRWTVVAGSKRIQWDARRDNARGLDDYLKMLDHAFGGAR